MKKDVVEEKKKKDIRNGVEYCRHNLVRSSCAFCSRDDVKNSKKIKIIKKS